MRFYTNIVTEVKAYVKEMGAHVGIFSVFSLLTIPHHVTYYSSPAYQLIGTILVIARRGIDLLWLRN